MRPGLRWLGLLGLTAAVGAGLAALLATLELDNRITAFLPAPADERQALVADLITRGPGATTLFAAIHGAEPGVLIETSRAFADAVAKLEGVERVINGPPQDLAEAFAPVLKIYPLLIPDPAAHTSPEAIEAALRDRLSELALAGRAVEMLIRYDPLGLIQQLAGRLMPTNAPLTRGGVWFDAGHGRALSMIKLAGAGYDIDTQQRRIAAIRAAFRGLDSGAELTLTGPPVFAADSARAAREDARLLSILGTVWVIGLLALAWRRIDRVIAGAVPLLSGLTAGLAAVIAGFGAIHGLALAFGFTLLGVAVDYPIHLLAHHPGEPAAARRRVMRPLALGVLSTVVAYLALWLSASPGLAQLGALSAVGLLVAAAVTLFVVPYLVPAQPVPRWRWTGKLDTVPHAAWLPALIGLIALAGLLVLGGRTWSDDLSRLSPVPPAALALHGELQEALGAGDVRYMIVLAADSRETALQETEAATAALAGARQRGLLEGWMAVTALVPSRAEQARRLAAWPSPEALAGLLEDARENTPFRAGAFEPFLDLIAELPRHIPITPDTWATTTLAQQVDALLLPPEAEGGNWRSLVIPVGLGDYQALSGYLSRHAPAAALYDLKAVSEAMVTGYRKEVLISLAVALGLIVLLLAWRVRIAELPMILLPSLAAVLTTALVMALAAGGLTIVHLMALILTAGIGLDYGLFMRHAGRSKTATFQSLVVCVLSTGGVFAILGLSSIALLAQLGNTVALGVVLAFVFALVARPR